MNLISNTKTVIFDDDYKEIENLRKALDQMLIQNIYIEFGEPDGLEERDEEQKITNVRFVFADILLGTKQESDSKVAVEPIVSSIINNISKLNGLFILILWSKDTQEHKDELIRTLKDDEEYKFITITDINKNEYIDKEGTPASKTIKELIEEIKEEINKLDYFNLLREWENETQRSIAKTFDLLLDVNDDHKTKDLLNGAIKSVVGTKQTADAKSKRKALWTSLNTVLQDTVETNKSVSTITDNIYEKLDMNVISNDNTNILNSKILFDNNITNDDKKMYPGNVFLFESYINVCERLKEQICGYKEIDSLISEIFDNEACFEFLKEECKTLGANTKKEIIACKNEQIKKLIPILLEFTPYCDYSQKGYKKARLIFGFIIPNKFRKFVLSTTKYLYSTPTFYINRQCEEGSYFMVLNIKHIFGVNPNLLEKLDLILRVRKELLNDIQHDIASHVSRVGVTSL
ncbi:hypothetical protein [Aliarcobacter butzleri]|uniref:hypothetical protein n=1 Tax=Aliarcobacter butzleri TaxID=28197 RepID=UPI0021B4D637|nr:hypothetical protein [Aliarcobacter butzleri]MCT7642621.1 hypothetical protein [Aliarcobacter butzleri]